MNILKVMMFIFVMSVVLQVAYGQHHIRCIPKERDALLQFKAAIVDRYGMLSSWTTPHCCQWEGIRCNNLDLHGEVHYESLSLGYNYQISSLSHLKYLNLADNYYLDGSIPRELGNLSRLQYLGLSGNSFEGYIPSQLGNLSNLHKLYLGGYHNALKIVTSNQWLSNLNSLTHLSFYSISNFNSSPSWLRTIAKLPKLKEVSLIECGLSDHFLLSFNPSNFNFSTSLYVLRLSDNSFTQPMMFQWVSNTTSNLVELDLSWNLLKGLTSNHFGLAMNSLEHLYLSGNVFKGEDLKSFMNICTLRSLYMFGNNMTEDLSSILHNFSSGCVRYSLQELSLTYNQITGSIPDLSTFSNLNTLDLYGNQLSGKILEGTRLPSHLEQLSIGSNSLKGGVPKSFGSTCTLELLDFSFNSLSEDLAVIFNHLSGCSRYSLRELYLHQNKFNGTLPDFSIFSKLETLDLSDNRLNGVQKLLRNYTVLRSLNLFNNSLSENLPAIMHHLSPSLQSLNLGMNQISGTLPSNLATMFPSLKELYLDSNKLNRTISEDLRFPTELEEQRDKEQGHCGVVGRSEVNLWYLNDDRKNKS
ncbi:probable LRR receptor-like serine/threonine-protein kinase At4g36180 [Vigna radiata var. radiata]|uniref:Probable LRR receptor-like serine/threonine-protein kinase At4g36180 n=1 Tax=Vigna radiata var. radiata TaxID=3916 RepID=A0A1S3U417_VIGRR|nr:probable LRR receptor-like serine/threonine-protein kinase At4g36180 [Vigna radiata var. radiata]